MARFSQDIIDRTRAAYESRGGQKNITTQSLLAKYGITTKDVEAQKRPALSTATKKPGTLGFLGDKFVSGAAQGAEGTLNFGNVLGQLLGRQQEQRNAESIAAMGALFGNKDMQKQGVETAAGLSQQIYGHNKGVDLPFDFGTRKAAQTEEKYADANIGKVGRFVGDAVGAVGQLATTVPLGLPGAFMSAGGAAMKEAKQAGKDDAAALGYGALVGGIEAGTEKIFGGLGGAFGKGALDDVAKAAIERSIKSKGAQATLKALVSAGFEGAEEIVAEIAQRIANEATIDTDDRSFGETAKDALYSGAVGAAVGGLGDIVSPKSFDKRVGTENEAQNQPSAATSQEVGADTPAPRTAESSENLGAGESAASPTVPQNAERLQDQQAANDVRAHETPRATGAAAAGFTETGEQGFAPTQSRGVTNSVWMDEQARAEAAPDPHQVITEQQSLRNATQGMDFDEQGHVDNYEEAVRNLLDLSDWNGADGDAAQILMAEARRRGDWDSFRTLAHRYNQLGTKAGQALQARKKWVAQSGDNIMQEGSRILDGQDNANETLEQMNDFSDEYDNLLDSEREVDGLIELIRRTARYRHTAGMFSGELSRTAEWALRHVVERGDIQFLRDLAANGILNIANDAIAPTAGNGARTYRRLAMLSKVSTIMRNLVSNGVFDITDTVSRDISVPLDIFLSRFTGTRSVAVDRGYFSQAKRQGSMDGLARSVLEVGLDIDTTGQEGRYENTANRTFHMSGGVASRVLSTWEKFSGYALQSTDAAARGGTEAEIQRGIDALYNRGLIRDDSLDAAGQTEGAYRTFQDDTRLSRATIGIRNAFNNIRIGGENGMGLGDIVLPFARTPANLASRALEYSPLGLMNGATQLLGVMRSARNGTLTAAQQAQAVQSIGRGLNGTALIAAATALSVAGVIKTLGGGKDDEDKDKAAYEKMLGQNGTQINLDAALRWLSGEGAEWRDGDTLVSISFLEPLNAQLTTGALIADDILSGEATLESVLLDSAAGTFKAVLDMPVMSVFADAANAYEYSTGDNVGSKAMDAALQYGASQISSFIPNAVKGIAQGTDKYQRDAYTADNIGAEILDNIKASLPGLRQQLPEKLDSFGKPVENEGGVLGFLNSNILPGAVTHYRGQTGDDILSRVYGLTGSAGVYPDRKAPNSVTVDGEKQELDAEAKREYLQATGQQHEAYLAAAENSQAFSALSTEQQQEVLNGLRLSAAGAGKNAIGAAGEVSDLDKARASLRAGDFVTYYSILTAANDVLDGATAQEVSTLEKLLDMGIPAAVGKVLEKNDGFTNLLEAVNAGVSVQHYYDYTVVKSQWNASPAPGYGSAPNWQKFNAIGGMNIPQEEKLALIGGVSENFLEKAQEAVNQGVSLSDVLRYYEAITARNADGSDKNKAEKNAAAQALNLGYNLAILNGIFG